MNSSTFSNRKLIALDHCAFAHASGSLNRQVSINLSPAIKSTADSNFFITVGEN